MGFLTIGLAILGYAVLYMGIYNLESTSVALAEPGQQAANQAAAGQAATNNGTAGNQTATAGGVPPVTPAVLSAVQVSLVQLLTASCSSLPAPGTASTTTNQSTGQLAQNAASSGTGGPRGGGRGGPSDPYLGLWPNAKVPVTYQLENGQWQITKKPPVLQEAPTFVQGISAQAPTGQPGPMPVLSGIVLGPASHFLDQLVGVANKMSVGLVGKAWTELANQVAPGAYTPAGEQPTTLPVSSVVGPAAGPLS